MKASWLVGVVAAAFLAPFGALAAGQARTIEIAVTPNGFEPARVKVTKGEPLKLVVTRKTDDTCAKEILIPDENLKADLPLNKPVTLSFTPRRTGEIRYSCGMNMITGVLEVGSPDGVAPGERLGTRDGQQAPKGMTGMSDDGQPRAMHRMRCGCMHGGDDGNGS
jgi:plastocyanin